MSHQVLVRQRSEPLPKEVPHVADSDEENEGAVYRDEYIVRRVCEARLNGTAVMLGGVSVFLVRAVPEFGMDSCVDLVRARCIIGKQ